VHRSSAQRLAALEERGGEAALRLVERASRLASLLDRQRPERLLQGEQLAAAIAEEGDARFFERLGVGRAGEGSGSARDEIVRGLKLLLERGRVGKHREGRR
jgi:hypothetical protein